MRAGGYQVMGVRCAVRMCRDDETRFGDGQCWIVWNSSVAVVCVWEGRNYQRDGPCRSEPVSGAYQMIPCQWFVQYATAQSSSSPHVRSRTMLKRCAGCCCLLCWNGCLAQTTRTRGSAESPPVHVGLTLQTRLAAPVANTGFSKRERDGRGGETREQVGSER